MTPNPPSSSDGSAIPPRHRPNLGNLAKDTTEQDLWAFDDLDPGGEDAAVSLKKSAGPIIPVPRDHEKKKGPAQSPKPLPNEERIKVNVNKPRPKAQAGPVAGQSKPGSDFDDLDELDHWDEPSEETPVLKISPEVENKSPEPTPVPELPAVELSEKPAPAEDSDEFSPPVAKAVAPANASLPKLNLTKVERIGLISLLAVLLLGGIAVFLGTINRLPTGVSLLESNDFPVTGKHLTIAAAENYWRVPKSSDAVRRDTRLIPVLKLKSTGGPAAIRVLFRNSEGDLVGDAVTRLIHEGKEIEVAATAGFDDVGMHAAYRAGQDKPWTIEVHEAPSENSSGADFKKLFQMNITSERR